MSPQEFETCVLHFVRKFTEWKGDATEDDRKTIDLLLTLPHSDDREKQSAQIYLRIERFVQEERNGERIAREVFREKLRQHCHPERAGGNLALLFLPETTRKIRLFELITERLSKQARTLLGEEEYRAFLNTLAGEFRIPGVLEEDGFLWQVLEKNFEGLNIKKRERKAETLFRDLLRRISRRLSLSFSSVRTEITFRTTYQDFRDQLDFLDDTSEVLRILPEEFFREEQVEILPKAKLEEGMKRKMHELEYALSQLESEKYKLSQALRNLEESDHAKGEFIAVVSHQFRTPLSVIRWNIEVITEQIEKLVPEEARAGLLSKIDAIYEKTIFLIDILEDMYDILALEGKVVEITRKPIQLWEFMSDALRELQHEAKRRNVELVFERDAVPLEEIPVDALKIKRIFKILLRNAIQYTSEKGNIRITITKTVYNGKPALATVVLDTGIGISEEDLPKLFSKFFRAKNAIRTVPDGAGLGLYLAKQFVQLHGGDIQVESELGKGSRFTVILPKE